MDYFGESLFYFVSLSIGIILFEGGLTLKLREIREVGPTIMRIISLGSLITFIGGALSVHFCSTSVGKFHFFFLALSLLRDLPLLHLF